MTYELWDTATRNIVGSFESEAAALAVVREAVRRHGLDYARILFLGSEDENGMSHPIAQGEDLAKRAEAAGMAQVSAPVSG